MGREAVPMEEARTEAEDQLARLRAEEQPPGRACMVGRPRSTESNAATIGPPTDPTRFRGKEMAAVMTPARMKVTRIAPSSDHRWPRVICQLRESPPTALSFSIMIAGV